MPYKGKKHLLGAILILKAVCSLDLRLDFLPLSTYGFARNYVIRLYFCARADRKKSEVQLSTKSLAIALFPFICDLPQLVFGLIHLAFCRVGGYLVIISINSDVGLASSSFRCMEVR